jgi:Aerotolerance regulator N-terminal
MNFVAPPFLWALAALSIPVIIHLFNFRRTTRIFFSNTRLLRQVKQETTQKRRLKRFWVLLCRLLFVFFLVMAFAQPFLPAKEQITSGKNNIIYLDNSFSMSGQVGEKIRGLDAASAYVKEIVNVFPADTRFRLLTNDFAPFSNSFKTRAEVLDLLTQLRLSPVSRSFNEVRQRIGPQSNTDIFFISDFQKSTFGTKNSLAGDSSNQWHLIPVSLGKTSNVFVDSLYLENPLMIGGEKNIVKARLHNTGERKIEGLIVKLTINGLQSATTATVLEPNSFAEVSFELTSRLGELNRARVSFNDFPVSFDNEFYFTLNLSEKINVLEIRSSALPTYVEKVYGNHQFFRFRSFQAGNVNYSLLDEADLVIINGLDKIEPGLLAAIGKYQSRFGSLLLIPGTHPDLGSYSVVAHPGVLKLATSAVMSDLEKPDFQNPFFENVFEDKSTLLTMPRAKPLLDWGIDRSAVLKFRTGTAFMSRNNNTFLMASPLQPDYTDLYNQALFVPVMYRLATSGKKSESKPYYTLSENLVTVRADSIVGEEPFRLVGGQQEIIPSQRRAGDKTLLDIPRFAINPGFYNVVHQRDTVDLVAFDLDKQESLTEQYNGDEIKSLLGGGKNISLFKASSADAFSNEIKERYLGTPLWKYALALALCFLLAEVLLIRFLK